MTRKKSGGTETSRVFAKGAPDSGFTDEPDRNKTSGQQTTF
ncbi:perC transcriptional activator family protein [Escherichia coli TW10119]|nr:perC transcriptional activator family protein [Escherichia coli TW10119]